MDILIHVSPQLWWAIPIMAGNVEKQRPEYERNLIAKYTVVYFVERMLAYFSAILY